MLQTYNNLIAKYSIRNYYIITYLIHTTTARHTPGGNIHGIQPLSGHIPIFFNYIHNHIHILLVHAETAVCIAVIGKTNVHSVLHHVFLQSPDMGRTGIVVDVGAIRLGIDHVGFGTESVKNSLARYLTSNGRGPIIAISPPDVKVETTFFQRKFFSTTPSNYPQKQYKTRTSDLSEVPILRCFLKTLPLSTPLPASYQIPPNCTLNDISP